MDNQVNETAEAYDFALSKVEVAEALQRLKASPDWDIVIEKGYFDNWALTQIRNVGSYNPEQLKGYLEQSKARGILDDYLYAIEEDGKLSKEMIPQLKQELEE